MRRVSKAEFHQPICISGSQVVTIGRTLPAANKTFEELLMTWSQEGLIVQISMRQYNIVSTEVLVPWANVVYCQFVKGSL